MSTTVKVYRSSDPGAPLIYYLMQPGYLFDMCLVYGYNTQYSNNVVYSNNIVTFYCKNHGFNLGQCILISNAQPSGLNGEVYLTSVGPNYFTYATSVTGSGTCNYQVQAKVAPAGWSLEAQNTYKQGSGNGMVFTALTNGQYWTLTCYESYNRSTLTLPSAWWSGYLGISSVTTLHPRSWIMVATDRHMFLSFNQGATAGATDANACYLGDLKSFYPGDAYATIGIASSNPTTLSTMNVMHSMTQANTTTSNHSIMRSYTGIAGPVTASKHASISIHKTGSMLGSAGTTYPSLLSNYNQHSQVDTLISPVYVCESSVPTLRGSLPGIWSPGHSKPFGHLETISGTGTLAGKKFVAINGYSSGQLLVEVSNTWDI